MLGLKYIRNGVVRLSSAELRTYLEIIFAVLVVSVLLKTFVIDAVYVPTPSMEGTICSGDFILVNKLVYGAASPKHVPFSHAGLPSFRLPGLRNVERGDVIVFEFPNDEAQQYADTPPYFVKRCVARGGDTLSVNNGVVVVNGTSYSGLNENTIMNGIHIERMIIPKRGDVIDINDEHSSQWMSLIRREGHAAEYGPSSTILIDGIAAKSYCVQKNYLFVLGDNSKESYDSRYWGLLPEDNVTGEALMVYWSLNPAKAIGIFSSVRWNRLGTIVR